MNLIAIYYEAPSEKIKIANRLPEANYYTVCYFSFIMINELNRIFFFSSAYYIHVYSIM